MQVRDLIEELKRQDQSAYVYVEILDENESMCEVEAVEREGDMQKTAVKIVLGAEAH